MEKFFLSPKLTGTRFDGHSIPLEFLKDLAVLEEMIIEIAKAKFLEENKDRVRSPKGFTEGIELKLTSIEPGSAIPKIALVVAGLLFPPENVKYYEAARDAIVEAIAAAESGGNITAHLPVKSLSYFDRLGRSLRDDEAIEFTKPSTSNVARLTKLTRKRLISASNVTEYTEDICLRGSVPEADQDDMSFEIQLPDGKKIKAALNEQHRDFILHAFTEYKSKSRIMINGVGRFDRSGKLKRLESVEHVTELDPMDVSYRLDEIRTLKHGWLEGEGVALPPNGIDWFGEAFNQHVPDEVKLPCIFPTPEGNLQAEWSFRDREITLEINLSTHVGAWHALDLRSDEEEEKSLDLNDAASWSWLVDTINQSSGVVA